MTLIPSNPLISNPTGHLGQPQVSLLDHVNMTLAGARDNMERTNSPHLSLIDGLIAYAAFAVVPPKPWIADMLVVRMEDSNRPNDFLTVSLFREFLDPRSILHAILSARMSIYISDHLDETPEHQFQWEAALDVSRVISS
jgi:hypothetical protein